MPGMHADQLNWPWLVPAQSAACFSYSAPCSLPSKVGRPPPCLKRHPSPIPQSPNCLSGLVAHLLLPRDDRGQSAFQHCICTSNANPGAEAPSSSFGFHCQCPPSPHPIPWTLSGHPSARLSVQPPSRPDSSHQHLENLKSHTIKNPSLGA